MTTASFTLLLFAVAALQWADSAKVVCVQGCDPYALQKYLCNGSLLSNSTLDLQNGTQHAVSRKEFCVVGTELMNVCISGAVAASQSEDIVKVVCIQAGNNSVLQEYLCNGSLLSNTILELQDGSHVIYPKGFCVFGTGLKNVRISGAGKGRTTVNCTGRWRYWFNRSQNITIEGLTFLNCGDNETGANFGTVLRFSSSISVSLNNVAFTNSYSYSVYGHDLTDCTMSDVDFAGCFNSSICYGAHFGGNSISSITIKRSTFVDLGQAATDYGNYAGLEVRGHVVDISDCTFSGNRGVALHVSESNVSVFNCNFVGNVAYEGSAIYAIDIRLLNVTTSRFDNNRAKDSGGAILLKPQNANKRPIVVVKNCSFENNTAGVGGAIFVYGYDIDSHVEFSASTFKNNSACIGTAIYIAGDAENAYGTESYGVNLIDNAVIENRLIDAALMENEYIRCDKGFRGNAVHLNEIGAAVYFNEISYLNITGNSSTGSQFIGNYPQGAIQGLRGRLHLSGAISFTNNTGVSGGAIYLTNDAHLYFHDGCTVDFNRNTASRFGGAIYVEGDQSIVTSMSTICAVHFWGNTHNIAFQDNHANIAGHAIYATPIYNCRLDSNSTPTSYPKSWADYDQFDMKKGVFMHESQTILSIPADVYLWGCSCGDTYMQNDSILMTYPGAKIKCNATLRDYANTLSPGVIYAQVVSGQVSGSSGVSLARQQEVQWIGNECTTIGYEIHGPENISVSLQLSTKPGTNLKSISMTLLPCRHGFTLQNHSKSSHLLECKCSIFLSSFGVTCDINHGTVRKRWFQWIGLYLDWNIHEQMVSVANMCPLKYCYPNVADISLSKTSDICTNKRSGVLCGHCLGNLSVVFGSAECKKCSNVWLLTILMYAALGAVLVAVLFALNLTVTSGTLYGPIFYANILVVNGTIFFSQTSLTPLGIIISFINLDLGFGLCFYDGMDDFAKTGLQFVFPVYLLVLTLTIVLISRYCLTWSSTRERSFKHKISQCLGKRAVSVLATLIYLSYSKVLRTVIVILTYTNIYLENKTVITVWFYDGAIKYLHGNHIVLFVLAVVAIVFITLYTFALTFIPILDVYSEKHKILKWLNQKVTLLKPINDAYYAPYKGKCQFWLGVRLWLVVCLDSLDAFLGSQNPSLLLLIHVILVILFVVIQARIMPFEEKLCQESGKKNFLKAYIRKYIYNLLDLFYLLNYCTLALTVSYLLKNENDVLENENDANITPRRVVVGVLVVMSLIVFFFSIFFHTLAIFFKLCKTGGQRCSENAHLGQNVAVYQSNEERQRNITAFTACTTANVNFDDNRLRESLLDDCTEMIQLESVTL